MYSLNISFDTDPQKADKLVSIVHKEIKNLLDNGPTETDLQKAREYFIKQRQEDLKENMWWSNMLLDYYFRNVDYVNGYEDLAKALEIKAVHEYAKKLFSNPDIIEVLMRP
jgi:zinc protease